MHEVRKKCVNVTKGNNGMVHISNFSPHVFSTDMFFSSSSRFKSKMIRRRTPELSLNRLGCVILNTSECIDHKNFNKAQNNDVCSAPLTKTFKKTFFSHENPQTLFRLEATKHKRILLHEISEIKFK